ncbi:MAG: RNA methyltransferase [Deltaproteobacteria bacterium]|nr:RNA methyltransferase [Deltaproteobacteria bacterium]
MDEQTVFGLKAGQALLEQRPQDVLRIFYHRELRDRLKKTLSWAASQRLPYRELEEEELRKVAASTHHEGLVVVARPLRERDWAEVDWSAAGNSWWLALDGVENPHNVGALLRTAAFFGVAGVVAGGVPAGQKVNSAAVRVAEGGAERVPVFGALKLAPVLEAARNAGLAVVGLETETGQSFRSCLGRFSPTQGVMLVLGGERTGLSVETRQACGEVCSLEGAGGLASLNVSIAAAVALTLLQVQRGSARESAGSQVATLPPSSLEGGSAALEATPLRRDAPLSDRETARRAAQSRQSQSAKKPWWPTGKKSTQRTKGRSKGKG